MLNAIEELKKYKKINMEFDQRYKLDLDEPDNNTIEKMLVSEINKLSKNQFKTLQKVDVYYEDVMQLLDEKMDKWDAFDKAISELQEKNKSLVACLKEEDGEKINILKKLILIVDVFENAASFIVASGDHTWIDQIERVMDFIGSTMNDAGISEIEGQGSIFNDMVHEVVEVVYDKDRKYREVISVEEKGYLYKGIILRKAKVIVNNCFDAENTDEENGAENTGERKRYINDI